MSTTRARTAIALVFAVVLAACTAAPGGVTTREANTNRPSVPATDPAADRGGSGTGPTFVEPTTAGLPALVQPDPAILIGQLDNGLRYLVRENDNPGGNVEMRLAVDAGSSLQDADQSGVAHFLEHMLFNGTEQFPENELIAVLRSFGAGFGADVNAYTSYDETVYELSMPSDDPEVVATGLDVLQQWLTAATLDPDAVVAERGVVLDEWRTRQQRAEGRVFDAIEDLFLTGSPYEGKDPIGSESAIREMTEEPLRRFYDDWYRPDNVAVVVVGDIDAATIEQGIVDRFGPVTPRGSSRTRIEPKVTPAAEPRARVLADPDVAEGFALVNLPVGVTRGITDEERLLLATLDELAFSIVETRLSTAAQLGTAPFDAATVDSSSIVRGLDAPEIVVDADGEDLRASVQAVLDEFERVRRFGFTEAEVARAVATRRSVLDSVFAGRESRQDRTFADRYVVHVLEGEAIASAESEYALLTAILDSATPGTVAFAFVERLSTTGAHMLVVVPEREAGAVPRAEVFEDMAANVGERDLDPPADEATTVDSLMATPAPVAEIGRARLSDGDVVSFVAPLVLTFDNGVRVTLNRTRIVDGNVAFNAASVGGLAAVADADVSDAVAAGPVVDRSGLGLLDRVTVDAYLADKDVVLESFVDQFTDHLDGFAATSDLEVLFQLVHLRMTAPRVDPVALEQYLDDELPYAADPSIDPATAEFAALLDARYDDLRFLLPTVESLATVDAGGIERVYLDRFGDASDWVFAFSGDFDVDTAIELSRRYLGTLPSTGRVEVTDFVEPPPPLGVVVEPVNAGQGDTATVSLLFTAPASADRRDDVAAALVEEIVSSRLTDSIREELGESYAPFAFTQLTGGATPNAEVFVSITADPDRVDAVSAAVRRELAELVAGGPTAAELGAAVETVGRDLNLYTNPGINVEVLAAFVDPAGNEDFSAYLGEVSLVETFSADEVRSYLSRWVTLDRHIEVRVRPR